MVEVRTWKPTLRKQVNESHSYWVHHKVMIEEANKTPQPRAMLMRCWKGEEPIQIYIPLTHTGSGMLKIGENLMHNRLDIVIVIEYCLTISRRKYLCQMTPILSGCSMPKETPAEDADSSNLSETISTSSVRPMEYNHNIHIWNSRASDSHWFIEDVRLMCTKHKPLIMVIVDTKSSKKMQNV